MAGPTCTPRRRMGRSTVGEHERRSPVSSATRDRTIPSQRSVSWQLESSRGGIFWPTGCPVRWVSALLREVSREGPTGGWSCQGYVGDRYLKGPPPAEVTPICGTGAAPSAGPGCRSVDASVTASIGGCWDVLDPDEPSAGLSMFVDRASELDSLRRALLTHRARMDAGLIDTTELRNVLVFYGEGGAGKSELSRQLQDWATGRAGPDHWGPPPARPADVAVRWDFNDSFGVVDPHPLLVALRYQLGSFRSSWPASTWPSLPSIKRSSRERS
jgi:hypothetical protein